MFAYFRAPVSWPDLMKRTVRASLADNVFNLAAQLGFYFFLGVFPAIMVLVALINTLPADDLLEQMFTLLRGVAPSEVVAMLQGQMQEVGGGSGGLLTFGILVALWSSSTALVAVISTLNRAYGIDEWRPFWKLRLTAILLTIGAAVFIIAGLLLIVLGPTIARLASDLVGWTAFWNSAWAVLRWPLAMFLVIVGVDLIYFFAPNADQDWVWITPGALLATLLWIAGSLGFNWYLGSFGDFDATYGALGGVVVAMLWFYLTGLAILMGAELNAEIDKASEHGEEIRKPPPPPGERKKIGPKAEREHHEKKKKHQEKNAGRRGG